MSASTRRPAADEARGDPVTHGTRSDEQQILLTGATGYLGVFLLDELLAQTAENVNCLVRAPDEGQARRRVRESLTHYRRWNDGLDDRITVTRGDLSLPFFGLSESEFATLAEATGTIVHNGALVNYLFPLSRMRIVNVEGTLSLLRLAVTPRSPIPFHFMSITGPPMSAYGKSKLEAEETVLNAAAAGLPASVYKICRLAPDSRTGLSNRNDILIRFLDAMLQVGAAPIVEFDEYWFPVDVAARAVVETAKKSCDGKVFSLVPREQTSLEYLLEVGREHGFHIEMVTLPDWLKRVRATKSSEHELTIRALRLDDLARELEDDDESGAEGAADPAYDFDGLPVITLDVPSVTRAALDNFFAHRAPQKVR
jgi:thioester reductase-like protein